MGPNAFARPGGTIAIIDELLERFDDPNVVAAILGHEMAHVSQKHSLAQLYRAGSTYLLITLIAGDPGPLLDTILVEGNALLSLAYSRGSMNPRRTVWASGSPVPPVRWRGAGRFLQAHRSGIRHRRDGLDADSSGQ